MIKTAYSAIVVAVDRNNGIGMQNSLLIKIPEDLKHFRDITLGSVVVMGRNTYDSLPNGALAQRTNIVITSDDSRNYPGCMVYSDLDQIFIDFRDEKIFFIGGATLYSSVLDRVDRLYITKIDYEFELCDTWFPQFSLDDWELMSKVSISSSPYRTTLCEYHRKPL